MVSLVLWAFLKVSILNFLGVHVLLGYAVGPNAKSYLIASLLGAI
jgi:hypothetical protein